MKILIYGDNHFSQYSSIVRRNGEKYSLRLENEIKSVNWAERLSENEGCDMIVVLGDFFDSSNLNSMELTALHEIKWAKQPHKFLVGNHELGLRNLQISSAHILSMVPNVEIIDSPKTEFDTLFNVQLCYLPYMFEDDRKDIFDYFPPNGSRRIIFSHNDISGIQMGAFVSKSGFSMDDIAKSCDLFINGHLHNGERIHTKIINCGNLTGQNFGEDATKYDHVALVLDTSNFQIAVFENPFAFNFYKVDFTNGYQKLNLKNNAVISAVCNEQDADTIKKEFDADERVVEYRLTIHRASNTAEVDNDIVVTDHLKMFSEFILNNMENNDIVIEELTEVCR